MSEMTYDTLHKAWIELEQVLLCCGEEGLTHQEWLDEVNRVLSIGEGTIELDY